MNVESRSLLPICRGLVVLLAAGGWGTGAGSLSAQDVERCGPAARFLTSEQGMVARTDVDTLDDWRSGRRLPACRVTAAGTRQRPLAVVASTLYERLREAGWTRTPNPADAPNEASLRFRLNETDCLFNVYTGILLGTRAEIEVSSAVQRQPGEQLYHVLAQCVPALAAREREGMADAGGQPLETNRAVDLAQSGTRRSPQRVGQLHGIPWAVLRGDHVRG